MKRFLIILYLCILCTGTIFAKNQIIMPKWMQGFFFDAGSLFTHEHLEPTDYGMEFEADHLLIEIGAGYDFGWFTTRLYCDFGILLNGLAYWPEGSDYISKSLEVENLKFGIEAALKVIHTEVFDLLVPVGFLFSDTEYKKKNPSYTTNNTAVNIIWDNKYTEIVSGLQASIKLGKHLKICAYGTIGYPLDAEAVYKNVLPPYYYWTDTNSRTYSVESGLDVFTFQAGTGLRTSL